jgi:hypothetical protein
MSLGFLVPFAWNQVTDLGVKDDLLIISGASYGVWLGSWVPYVFNGHMGSKDLWAPLVLSDVGLLGSAAILVGGGPGGRRLLGRTFLWGLVGMGVGTGAVSVVSSNTRPIATGMLIGTVAGMLAGAVSAGIEGYRAQGAPPSPTAAARQRLAAVREDQDSWRLPGLHVRLPLLAPYTDVVPAPNGKNAAPALIMGVMGPL